MRNDGLSDHGRLSKTGALQSGSGNLPQLVESIASLVTGLAVLSPKIQWLAFQGPLLLSIITGDDCEIARGPVSLARRQGWPVGGAWPVASGLGVTCYVLVKRIQRHAVGTSQDAVSYLCRRI